MDSVIWSELVKGIISEKSREGYDRIIDKLVGRGAKGIILGCTEIPLLIKSCSVKTYDTATIHAKAILEYAMEGTSVD